MQGQQRPQQGYHAAPHSPFLSHHPRLFRHHIKTPVVLQQEWLFYKDSLLLQVLTPPLFQARRLLTPTPPPESSLWLRQIRRQPSRKDVLFWPPRNLLLVDLTAYS